MASRRTGRIIAFQALYAWDMATIDGQDLLDFSWLDGKKQKKLDESTQVFSRHLIMGTIENIKEIDRLITAQLKNWDFERVNKVDLAILRLSCFSLLYQRDIAPSIVIDEAIDISKDFGSDDSFRFVNGILDAIAKKEAGDDSAGS